MMIINKNISNIELLKFVKKYKTFSGLLKNNKKLYYMLHNRGILKEGCMHLKRKKNRYSKGVIDIKMLLEQIFKYDSYEDMMKNNLSLYIILKRHGINSKELYENKEDEKYIKNIIKEFSNNQLNIFIS